MSWPTPQDYNEAIQNPGTCFWDRELRSGVPTLTPFGLPRPMSGNFATVYRLNCSQRNWAVRCFSREVRDQERRYSAIGAALNQTPLSFMVGFDFLSRGILVRGTWYPLVKMEWVEGRTLNEFIEANLNQPQLILSIADQMADVLAEMRSFGIAHGDLQHGNILISNGRVVLIDYDGMFVPALAGLPSHETGHPNYQRPDRTGSDFNPNIDTFSGLVIYLSLRALATDPSLWNVLNGGDECLLLRRTDFEAPKSSKAFQLFEASSSLEVRELAHQLRSCLESRAAELPPISGTDSLLFTRARAHGLPGWLEDNLTATALQPLAALGTTLSSAGSVEAPPPFWLADHIEPEVGTVSKWGDASFVGERTTVVLVTVILLALGILMVSQIIPIWLTALLALVAIGGLGIVLKAGYESLPYFTLRQATLETLSAWRNDAVRIETALQAIEAEVALTEEPLLLLQERYSRLPEDLRKFQRNVNEICNREAMEARAEVARFPLMPSGVDLKGQIECLAEKVESSEQREQEALSVELQSMREKHIEAYLKGRDILTARLPGIGPKLTQRLLSHGLSSAADVVRADLSKVPGIGTAKAAVLRSWANSLHGTATRGAPRGLPDALADAISSKYRSDRASIRSRLDILKQRQGDLTAKRQKALVELREAVSKKCARIEEQRSSRLNEARQWFDSEAKRTRVEYNRLYQQTTEGRKALVQKHNDLIEALRAARMKLSRCERDLSRFEAITFWEFFGRVTSRLLPNGRARP
jgi:serine/threonine protein kinase